MNSSVMELTLTPLHSAVQVMYQYMISKIRIFRPDHSTYCIGEQPRLRQASSFSQSHRAFTVCIHKSME